MSSLSQPSRSTEERESRSTRTSPNLVLVIVCAGVVLASLDLFIVNVALPQMSRSFGATGLDSLSWVLNGYAIVYASLLVLFGRLADRYRRERGFLLGVAVFVAASAACAAATSRPRAPGGRRRAAHTNLAGADPGHVPARAPSQRGAHLDRRRRCRRSARPGRRRPARRR